MLTFFELSQLRDVKQLSGNCSETSFFGLKSNGRDCEGYRRHSNTLKLFGGLGLGYKSLTEMRIHTYASSSQL